MARLTTVKQVVDAVGRPTLMSILGVTTGAISNYLAAGRFPDSATMLRTVREVCKAEGHELDERLFGEGTAKPADAA